MGSGIYCSLYNLWIWYVQEVDYREIFLIGAVPAIHVNYVWMLERGPGGGGGGGCNIMCLESHLYH